MLFEPERHEPLTDIGWDEDRVRDAIEAIVADTHNAYGGVEKLWQIHPIDISDERAPVLLPVYYGAAGVIWALQHLNAQRRNYLPALDALLERNRSDFIRLTGRAQLSFATGDAGILLLNWLFAPSENLATQLHSCIEGNFRDRSNGFTAGASGTMRVALFLYERTGEARWADLFRRNAAVLLQDWTWHDEPGCHLWTQDLHGEKAWQLGALHGFAGNAFVLLAGKHLLSSLQQDELTTRSRNTFFKTALREGRQANWELCARPSSHPGMKNIRVQHCTGAPGMVNTLHLLPRDADTDGLLTAAGELIWAAGPLRKIPSLCHGVPGSGYAFLKLYGRTGEAVWLDRARAFAMHALTQNDRYAAQYGQRKYSLWTGDLGLAVYLKDCVEGVARIPMLDVF